MSATAYPQLEILRKLRISILNTIKDLTLNQLNKIPEGYNNNIIWNVAHLVAAQEGVCYLRAGHQITVPEHFFNSYKSGTIPQADIDENEVELIKQLLITSVDQLESDFQQNKFENYAGWTTRYSIDINNISDAINFLPFHEGIHLGYIMALKRNQEL